jgi:hypothetical protein
VEIETMMTYLEHERRGKCGEYEIAYTGKQVLHADESKEADGSRTIWCEMYVSHWHQDIDKNCDDSLSTFQALHKSRVDINIGS